MSSKFGTAVAAFIASALQELKYACFALTSSRKWKLRSGGKVSDYANFNAGADISARGYESRAWDRALGAFKENSEEKLSIEREYTERKRSGYNYRDNSVKMDELDTGSNKKEY